MQPTGPTQYFKVERDGVLVGLFQSNSPDIIQLQMKLLSDFKINEVREDDYRRLQASAKWNGGEVAQS
jgi:hypothetical protein